MRVLQFVVTLVVCVTTALALAADKVGTPATVVSADGGDVDFKQFLDRIPNGHSLFDSQSSTAASSQQQQQQQNMKENRTQSKSSVTIHKSGAIRSPSHNTTAKSTITDYHQTAFAKAFKAAGYQWTSALCEADTDGDGQTNGQELGDPCCSWMLTDNLAYIRGTSDPSDPQSKVNPEMFGSIMCTRTKSAEQDATATKRIKNAKTILSAIDHAKNKTGTATATTTTTEAALDSPAIDKPTAALSPDKSQSPSVSSDPKDQRETSVTTTSSGRSSKTQASFSVVLVTVACGLVLSLYQL